MKAVGLLNPCLARSIWAISPPFPHLMPESPPHAPGYSHAFLVHRGLELSIPEGLVQGTLQRGALLNCSSLKELEMRERRNEKCMRCCGGHRDVPPRSLFHRGLVGPATGSTWADGLRPQLRRGHTRLTHSHGGSI